MTPGEAAGRLLQALVLGGWLGLLYGLLAPLRQRAVWLGDLLFVAEAFREFLYLSFAVCAGDIRLPVTAGLPLGFLAVRGTLGPALDRAVSRIFNKIALFFGHVVRMLKKFLHFLKILFASVEK